MKDVITIKKEDVDKFLDDLMCSVRSTAEDLDDFIYNEIERSLGNLIVKKFREGLYDDLLDACDEKNQEKLVINILRDVKRNGVVISDEELAEKYVMLLAFEIQYINFDANMRVNLANIIQVIDKVNNGKYQFIFDRIWRELI